MSLKPWREVAVPHDDVLKGSFTDAEFAADISRVKDGKASVEYQDAQRFFARTFITEGMALLLDSVLRRLGGQGGDPVIQLQTAFGGGKTHTLLAVMHLVRHAGSSGELPGIAPLLDQAALTDVPRSRIAVIDGTDLSPAKPRQHEGAEVRTLWGELAWQLGGKEAYGVVAEADAQGVSPGKAALAAVLEQAAPCVILMDELVAYFRQFPLGRSYAGGTLDSNLTFIQSLTEAVKAVPRAVLLASLPASDTEAGGDAGQRALHQLEHLFGRLHALWKPVSAEEAFAIVRRRLFDRIVDEKAMEGVCRAYSDFYVREKADFPVEAQDTRYMLRLREAYPFHPEIFDRLYEDWSTLERFQRTRGVLQLLAQVVYRLWQDDHRGLLIMPGSLPLYDPQVRNKAVYYLPQGWDAVIDRDIDGRRAEATEIDQRDTRLGAIQAARRAARTIFLGSAPRASNRAAQGVDMPRILLGCAEPEQPVAPFRDAVGRLKQRLYYLTGADERFWFDTRPNLRREMEERKRRLNDRDQILPEIKRLLERNLGRGFFNGIHVMPATSGDVPDDYGLRLVVLPPTANVDADPDGPPAYAAEILTWRGDQPRQKQNRIIFLMANEELRARLRDEVAVSLAWRSLKEDADAARANLDRLQMNQVRREIEQTDKHLPHTLRATYNKLLLPEQDLDSNAKPGPVRWVTARVDSGRPNLIAQVQAALTANEWVIEEWAPIHLQTVLKQWYWRGGQSEVGATQVWRESCQYLYMARLADSDVFRRAVEKGLGSEDFFGYADGKDRERYLGFRFGQSGQIDLTEKSLLIRPAAARAYRDQLQAVRTAARDGVAVDEAGSVTPPTKTSPAEPAAIDARGSGFHRYFGTVDLDPLRAKIQFADAVDEVLAHLAKAGANVSIHVDIQAISKEPFKPDAVRTVRENANTLGFKNSEFVDE
jgi:predicted AAA+ superfamily ATPase